MKLSENQKEVIDLFNKGWKAENTCMFKNGKSKWVGCRTFESLVRRRILYARETSWSVVHYYLTELGKTINID